MMRGRVERRLRQVSSKAWLHQTSRGETRKASWAAGLSFPRVLRYHTGCVQDVAIIEWLQLLVSRYYYVKYNRIALVQVMLTRKANSV